MMLTMKTKFRLWLGVFMVGLVVSGATAFFIVPGLGLLDAWFGTESFMADWYGPLAAWISTVHDGVVEIGDEQPWMFYGTDWLAFGHVMIAVAFVGPWVRPVPNKWVIDFGIIACIAVIPAALLMGPVRGIPFFWQVIDCSFGVLGIIPLLICRRTIRQMERAAR